MSAELRQLLAKLISSKNLTIPEASRMMQIIYNGGANPSQIASFLTSIYINGITAEMIVGAVNFLYSKYNITNYHRPLLNLRSIGSSSFNIPNISLPTALILAAADVKVLLTGNRGHEQDATAEILFSMGYNINLSINEYHQILDKYNFTFIPEKLYLPKLIDLVFINYDLGFTNFFNIVAPFLTSLNAKYLFIGCLDKSLHIPFIQASKMLGYRKVWLFANGKNINKIIPHGTNYITELNEQGKIRTFNISQEDFGHISNSDKLYEYSTIQNNRLMIDCLSGSKSSYSDLILVNSAAALYFMGKTNSIINAIKLTTNIMSTKLALKNVKKIIGLTNRKYAQ